MNLKTLKTFLFSASFETFLFSLTILLLPTQLGRHFWPDFSYVYSLKIDYLSPTLYLWDILVYGLVLLRLLKGKIRGIGEIWVIGGVFLLMLVPSILVTEAFGVGLARLTNVIPALLWGIYIASASGEWIRKQLLKYLPWTIIWVSTLGILQFLKGGTLGFWILGERSFDLSTPGISTFNWYGQVFLRPYSTFPHPNLFAAFLVVTLLILLFLKTSRLGALFLTTVMIASVGLVLSFSRSVTIIYVAILGFLFRKQVFWLVIAGLFLFPLFYVRFESAFNFDQLSLTRREELTEASFTLIQQYPWFGIGLNNYIPTAASSSFLSGTNRFLQPVHNIFLLTWVESGALGLLGLLGMLGVCLWSWGEERLLTFSQRLSLVLIIVFLGMIDHYFLTLAAGQRLFFLIWGISLTKKN